MNAMTVMLLLTTSEMTLAQPELPEVPAYKK